MSTKRIAVCGKGGVGKTTVVCGILNYLLETNKTPVLLVDADPNSNLAENLGITYSTTIADVREELRSGNIPQNISKSDYIMMRLQECIIEQNGFDFVIMGHPEGRECYCYINELLRTFLSNLTRTYRYVLIDTEAGMEHLSRRTTDNIDLLFIITTPAKTSIDTVNKIIDLIPKLKLKIYDTKILLNLAENNVNNIIKSPFLEQKIVGVLHKDDQIYKLSEQGVPLLNNISTTNFYTELKLVLEKTI